MSGFPKDGGRAILISHADQLRAQVMNQLYTEGNEWTHDIEAAIAAMLEYEDDPQVQMVGMLAKIGFFQVFIEAAESASEDARNDT